MLGDESRRLHEHAAQAVRGIENTAMKPLDDLGEPLHDAARRIEFAALLPLGRADSPRKYS